MTSLAEDLQKKKNDIEDFKVITERILEYMPAVITDEDEYKGYRLCRSESAGSKKYIRPIRNELFLKSSALFLDHYEKYIAIINRLKNRKREINSGELHIIDSVTYTIMQSIGIGLDLLTNPNSARKHIGNRFEEFIKLLFSEIGVTQKKIVLKIPYEEGTYSCETDVVISPFETVKSNNTNIYPNETIVGVKTSSKDRMGKIFIDKLLMERFVGRELKVLAIFLNDVQRKENEKVSYTFVSGLFMVYTKFLTNLKGVYFVDLPPAAMKEPYTRYIFPFSQLIAKDIWSLVI